MKNLIIRGGFTEIQYTGHNHMKRGSWTVYSFERELSKRDGGVLEECGDTPIQTM